MTKISVIIPIYNVEQYLKECLDSVINQTFKDLEIICIDDCSQDFSLQIAENYAKKDSRIKIIKHSHNKGLGPARNTGINAATGEYIFFLDSDDYLNVTVIEQLYNKIIETKASVVFSQTKIFTNLKDRKSINRVNGLSKWIDCSNIEDFYVNMKNFERAISEVNCVAWGKLYSTEFIKKNNIFFIDGKVIHEDNGFWLKICSRYPKIAFIQDIGVYYRIRENAITTEIDKKENKHKKHKHMKMVLKDTFTYMQKHLNKKVYKSLVLQIKNSREYHKYFYFKLIFLFKLKWLIDNKEIRLLNLLLFNEKPINNKKIGRLLGLKIYTTETKCQKVFEQLEEVATLELQN